ncbi:hypothetical protein PF004_g11229 [Phytophthora fragariae]|uniref:ABC transporter domain-containing protein n=1 Tax=Phytophthora fragariae TaxID=53985 RepID=A0A6G0NYM9_9STRA|nr:hypothetical protein PF004_g11229 [Phytophthora fragariae]
MTVFVGSDAEQLMARTWSFIKMRVAINDELETKVELFTATRDDEQAALTREWEDVSFLPDLTQDNGVSNINMPRLTINFKYKSLVSDTALQSVDGRRYGIVRNNGAGKTKLLRYISQYEPEGFQQHLRIQLVEQEFTSKLSKDERSMLEMVLAADYERSKLLQEEKELTAE